MLERVWRKGMFLHCWWKCTLIQSLWKISLFMQSFIAMNFPLKTDFATFHKLYVVFLLPLSQDIFKNIPLFVYLAALGLI